jgi:hypothetical protein
LCVDDVDALVEAVSELMAVMVMTAPGLSGLLKG